MNVRQVRILELIQRGSKWVLTTQKGPFRFRSADVVLWWVLVSLVAISLIADHPLVALTIAIAGGIMIGILCVLGSNPR